MAKRHNAHMLIPVKLWKQAKRLAKTEGVSVTALVVEGLRLVLASRKGDS